MSVIVPAWNRRALLPATIDSVLAQTLGDLELIVADDGSTDGTPELVEELASRDARIALLRLRHGGKIAALTAGLARASAPRVAFLDSDDVWHPRFLEVVDRALTDAGPRTALAYARFRYFRHGERPDDRASWLAYQPRYYTGAVHRPLIRRNFIVQDSALVRRECLDAVGAYASDTRGQADEWDLWLRLARRYEVRHVPWILTFVRIHGENMSHDLPRQYRAFVTVLEAERRRCASAREAAALGVPAVLARYRLALARKLLASRDLEGAALEARRAIGDAAPLEALYAAALVAAGALPGVGRVLGMAQETVLRARVRVAWGAVDRATGGSTAVDRATGGSTAVDRATGGSTAVDR